MSNDIFRDVDDYITGLFAKEDEALELATSTLVAAGMPNYSVSPSQGKLLHLLARMCSARRILEVGTLGGYSTVWMARALPEEGQLISLEIDEHHADVARQNIARAGLAAKVEVRVGPAAEEMERLVREGEVPFDMIFIDADKPPYPVYLEHAVRLSHRGTLIVADNVIAGGGVLNSNATGEYISGIRSFNEALSARKDLTATIIQTVGVKGHDGLALAVVT